MRNARGFTLVELLVVITIVGLLASVIMVSLNTTRAKGQHTRNLQIDAATYHTTGDSLVGAWLFDECSGTTVADASGLGRTGTFGGSPTWSTNTPFGTGCALSTGGTGYVTMPTISISNSITVAAWFYTSNNSQNGMLVEKDPVNTQWEIFLEGGYIKWRGGNPDVTTPVPTANTWHYVVAVQNDTSASLYVDGGLRSSRTVTTIGNGTGAVLIGRFTNGYNFNGLIDNVRIYDRALEVSEIQKLYTLEAPAHGIAVR